MCRILIIIFILFFTDSQANFWNQKASLPYSPAYGGVGFSIGNKGYIATGYVGGSYSQELWEWDPTINVWTQKANLPALGRARAYGFSIGLKGYLGGGNNWSVTQNDFWEWDQLTNTWTQKTSVSAIPIHSAVCFSIGNLGYIGTGNPNFGNDFWEYNPILNTWSQKANFSGATRWEATGFSIGSKGYIGSGSNGGQSKDFWEWDQSNNSWTQIPDLPGPGRSGAVGFSIGSKGYVGMGHGDIFSPGHLNDLWEYDQVTGLWTQLPDLPAPGRANAVGFSIGQYGYVGTGEYMPMYNDFWEFCPFGNCFVGEQEVSAPISTVSIYPNPCSDILTISKANALAIFDFQGKPILNFAILEINAGNIKLDVSKLPDGLYFLTADRISYKFTKIRI